MLGMEWILELALTGLLIATLFHALRLEQALGGLRRDRTTLESAVAGFKVSMEQAEASIVRLREATESAGRDIAHRVDSSIALKDDLALLSERGHHAADRLDVLIRAARPLIDPIPVATANDSGPINAPVEPNLRSQAERDLLKALRMAQ